MLRTTSRQQGGTVQAKSCTVPIFVSFRLCIVPAFVVPYRRVQLYCAVHTSYCTGICRTGPCLDSCSCRFKLVETAVMYIVHNLLFKERHFYQKIKQIII